MQYSFPSLDSSFSPPQASPLNDLKLCKKIIAELQNGRRAAIELHHHFFAARDHVSTKELQVSAAELLARIISSFFCCFTVMAGGCDHQGKEQEGKRMSRNEEKQRGGFKKRKVISVSPRDPEPESVANYRKQTKVVETTDLTDDGHAWRKYGHKWIKCSSHPRDYYKCTYWKEELCQATKWVQKLSDQPSIYRTTYDKEHTCRNSFGASHLTIKSTGFSSLVDQSADSCTYLSFGGKSNHPSTTTGTVTVDCQENHEYSVLQPNSLLIATPPPSSSSSSSSSLSIMLQDIENLNNSDSLQQTTIGSAKNHEIETAETTSEDTIDLMQFVEMPTNPYDLSEILSSSDHIISDLPSVAPINMGDQDQYYVGDARSSVEAAFIFPTTSNCNYMTMQQYTVGHDAFDTVMDMYLDLDNVFCLDSL